MSKPKGFKEKEKKRGMSKDGISSMVWESKFNEYLINGGHFGHDTDRQRNKKKKGYNNGIENIVVSEGEQVPDGFVPGMWQRRPGGYAKFEYKGYTNGKESKRLSLIKGDIIPEGGGEGQSDEQAEKSRNSPRGKHRTEEQIEHHKRGAIKQGETKKLKGVTNSSSKEELWYKGLCSKYTKDDVFRNYNYDSRYPWHCDFYIKSLDLFIELNMFPTHYKEPFDSSNNDHLKLLDHCINSPDNGVQQEMINVGANADVEKFNTAINNNLNYMMIYYNTYKCINNAENILNEGKLSKDFTMM